MSLSNESPRHKRPGGKHFVRSLIFGVIFGITAAISLVGIYQAALLATGNLGDNGLASASLQTYLISAGIVLISFSCVIFVTWLLFVRPAPLRHSSHHIHNPSSETKKPGE